MRGAKTNKRKKNRRTKKKLYWTDGWHFKILNVEFQQIFDLDSLLKINAGAQLIPDLHKQSHDFIANMHIWDQNRFFNPDRYKQVEQIRYKSSV